MSYVQQRVVPVIEITRLESIEENSNCNDVDDELSHLVFNAIGSSEGLCSEMCAHYPREDVCITSEWNGRGIIR